MSCKEPEKQKHDTCFAERRRNHRLSVRLDVVVRLQEETGRSGVMEQTTTENISPGDMYFESSLGDRLRVGDLVDVDIELPVRTSTIFSEKRLAAKGQVVRLDRPSSIEPNRRGVAIIFLKAPAFYPAIG